MNQVRNAWESEDVNICSGFPIKSRFIQDSYGMAMKSLIENEERTNRLFIKWNLIPDPIGNPGIKHAE